MREEILEWRIKNFKVRELGKTGKWPIYLLEPKTETKKKVLIAAGFHGNEVAGVLGVKKFLETYRPTRSVGVAFLPLVNPSGFAINHRNNKQGENPNRGFCHQDIVGNTLSVEGKILVEHKEQLLELAKNGFLSLHEDPNHEKFYIYTFKKGKKPGRFSQKLMEVGAKYFGQYKDGKIVNEFNGVVDESCLQEGFCMNKHDGSFEDYLFEAGVPITYCSETPMKRDLKKRICANVEIVKTFINFINKSEI